jgi:hypothetical protein
MPSWFSRVTNLVWTAVVAVVAGTISVAAALYGSDIKIVVGFGAFGLIMATLAPST